VARPWNQEILLDVGGVLVFEAPYGRASSATCTINKPDGTSIAAPTVTIDACNTTVSTTASAGATELRLAAGTGVTVGRSYLANNGENQAEWIKVKAISGTTLTLYEPLRFAYASSGDSVVGTRLTAPVSAVNCGTLDEGYEWRISATIDGTAYVWVEQYDVVRSLWPERLVEAWEIQAYLGDLASTVNRSRTDSGDHLAAIEAATERVRIGLMERGLKPSRFRSFAEFKRPVAMALALGWAENGWGIPGPYQDQPLEWLEHRKELYVDALTTAMNTVRSYDDNESGNVDSTERTRQIGWVRLRR